MTGQVTFSDAALGSTLSEVGSIQVEFRALSSVTSDPRFMYRGEAVMDLLGSLLQGAGGLLPIMLQPTPPMKWTNSRVTLGGRGDSFYEYLLKRWLQTNRTEERYLQQYRTAVDGIRRSLVGHSPHSNLTFVREVDSIVELFMYLQDPTRQWHPVQELQGMATGQMVFFVTMSEEALDDQRDEACMARLSEGDASSGRDSGVFDSEKHRNCPAQQPDAGDDLESTEKDIGPQPSDSTSQECASILDEGADEDDDKDDETEEEEDGMMSFGHLEKMVKMFSQKVGQEDRMAMVIIPKLPGEEACAVAELVAQKRWDEFLQKLQIGLPPCVKIGGQLLDTIAQVARNHFNKQCARFGSFKMDHLACFLPGVLALGVWAGAAEDPRADLHLADSLCRSCVEMWRRSPTGLAPDSTLFGVAESVPDVEVLDDASYSCIRPETIESLWYMYMVTGDPVYQDMGWDIFQAIEANSRVASGGYSGVEDVRKVHKLRRRDRMETFVLSETFKYLFLLFAEEPIVDLDQVVLNTEGHVLPVIDPRD